MTPDPRALIDALLPWYGRRARDLPWRRDPSPYEVLLSELMLQQTRVDTVVPYFERFTARWPTVEDLAAAEPDEVLGEWAGLGYYSRARNLHACAREAAAQGGLPDTAEGLRRLPGIGPYTAGAIASIAFGRRAPLVDGNVERVLNRIDARAGDPRSTAGKKALWARAGALQEALHEDEAPGDWNQALMELGATVCLPRNPSCLACPVRALCQAHAAGSPERYPELKPRTRPTPVSAVYAVGRLDGGWVLGKRPPGLLGGLFEPIGAEVGTPTAAALESAVRERTGLRVVALERVGTVKHTFSHRKLTAAVWRTTFEGSPEALEHYVDVRVVRDVEEVALSKLARKLLALADGGG